MKMTQIMRALVPVVIVVSLVALAHGPTMAQEADGYTVYQLNMRVGPGISYAVITTLPGNTGIIFEARNQDMSWLLGKTEDGLYRGWVASLYLNYRENFAAFRLPVSNEAILYESPTPEAFPPDSTGNPNEIATAGDLAPAGLAPSLDGAPIVPSVGANVSTIFARGQSLGNNPHLVTKVGECNSMSYAFLAPFDTGLYDLGPFGGLQSTVATFSFVNPSLATGAGYTAQTVISERFGDPGLCGTQSPLVCEYQRSQPSVAFIMLGMHDVHFLNAIQYETAMRQIIEISIENGVIPVLTTFPIWPSDDQRTEQRFAFNNILLNLSREYGVPLMNFWKAANGVQHSGVGEDHVHVTERGDNWTSFNGDENLYGMTMWNLVALQTLAQIQAAGMN
jgi:hypothetical protein